MNKKFYFVIIITLFIILTNCFLRKKTIPNLIKTPGKITKITGASYYLPANYSDSQQYPLIILLHGFGNTDANFLKQHQWRAEAEKRGYILCSIKSNRSHWSEEKDSPDCENIKKIVYIMEENFSIRKNKICIFGWSSGANFTNTMLLFNKHPYKNTKLFTAFISGSGGAGYLFEKQMKHGKIPGKLKVPGYIFWGEQEITLPGKSVSEFLIKNKWDITTNPHNGHHYIPVNGIENAFNWLDNKIP